MELLVALCWFAGIVLTPIIADRKHRSVAGWLLLGLLFGLLAFLVILCLPAAEDPLATVGQRQCPACLSWVPQEATACRHCGRDLPPWPTTQAPHRQPVAYTNPRPEDRI